MYDVLDVSRYVINYSNKKGYGISNLKLQKLLYFIQAAFLTSEIGKACFNERIEAWDFGPVVPIAYREFKHFGSSNIPEIKSIIKFDGEDIWDSHIVPFDDSIISEGHKNSINEIIDTFKDYSATDLVTLTHNQSPWLDAYAVCRNNEISLDSIKEYFS